MNDLGRHVLKQYKKLSQSRLPLETIWEDAFEYSYPLRGQRFVRRDDDYVSNAWNYEQDNAQLFDTTGKDACRLLASSLLSGLTPPNMQWFTFSVPSMGEEEIPQEARVWLDQSASKLFQMIHASNYDAEAYEFFLDITIGGMSGLFVELIPGQGYRFEYWPMETMFCAETLKRGKIDTVFRRIQMTASQMAEKFGVNKLPQGLRDEALMKKTPSDQQDRHEVIHCIRPRMKGKNQSKGKTKRNMPWESVWVLKKGNTVLGEFGFPEFPVVIPRWHKIPDSDYAVGAFDDALPDVKTLNNVVRLMLTHADMAIAGMFVAKDDGVINPNSIKVAARQFFFAADTNNIKPLTAPGNFSIATAEIERLQRNVRKIMMTDQLQPQDGPAMTATEIHVRMQLVRQLLGPVYGRFMAEFLQPLIERTFNLALREGYFGVPPESIGGTDFIPSYQSPLARAQKQEDVSSMTQFEMALSQTAAAKPEVLDLYDFDKATRTRADLLGVPADLMRNDRDVQALRDQRAEQEQAAAMQEAVAEATKAE